MGQYHFQIWYPVKETKMLILYFDWEYKEETPGKEMRIGLF